MNYVLKQVIGLYVVSAIGIIALWAIPHVKSVNILWILIALPFIAAPIIFFFHWRSLNKTGYIAKISKWRTAFLNLVAPGSVHFLGKNYRVSLIIFLVTVVTYISYFIFPRTGRSFIYAIHLFAGYLGYKHPEIEMKSADFFKWWLFYFILLVLIVFLIVFGSMQLGAMLIARNCDQYEKNVCEDIITAGKFKRLCPKMDVPDGARCGEIMGPIPSPTPKIIPKIVDLELIALPETLRPGMDGTLQVFVDSNQLYLGGGDINLGYDPKVIEVIDIVPGQILGPSPVEGVSSIDNEDGTLRYIMVRRGPTTQPTAPGVFAEIRFLVKPDADSGAYVVEALLAEFSDHKFQLVLPVSLPTAQIVVEDNP